EGEVREERLLRDLDGAAQPALGALEVLPLVQQNAVEHGSVEVIGEYVEGALEVVLGPVEVAIVEEHLAEEKRQLVVVAVQLERFFQRLDPAVGLEGVDGRLGLGQQLQEALALVASEERGDAVLPLDEALLLFQRQHLL